MAVVHFAPTLKDQVLAPVLAAIDAGAGPGYICIYAGSMPTDTTVAVVPASQPLLGTLTFADPAGDVGVTTPHVLTIDTTPALQDSTADATGTASWARVYDSTGAAIMDLNVTTTGGGGALTLNTTNIVIGGPILITSFVISVA